MTEKTKGARRRRTKAKKQGTPTARKKSDLTKLVANINSAPPTKKEKVDVQDISLVTDPIYKESVETRLDKFLKDFENESSPVDKKLVAAVISRYVKSTPTQVQALGKGQDLSYIERITIKRMLDADSKSKSAVASHKLLLERSCGKPDQAIEHTGKGGGAISIEQTQQMAFDDFIDAATPEQLEQLEQAAKMFIVEEDSDE